MSVIPAVGGTKELYGITFTPICVLKHVKRRLRSLRIVPEVMVRHLRNLRIVPEVMVQRTHEVGIRWLWCLARLSGPIFLGNKV